MKKIVGSALFIIQSCFIGQALAQPPVPLTVKITGISEGTPIPSKFAYCTADDKGRTKNGDNISPAIAWSGAPAQTKSYALIVVDPDVPANFDTANKPDKIIPMNFARQNFYHWVLINIPTQVTGIFEGKNSSGVTAGGKPVGRTSYGTNGINGYGFGGYDGPCPPWNDERLHHYHFIVYALDVASLNLPDPVNGSLAKSAMTGHILAQGEVMGTYTTNPTGVRPGQ